MAGFERFARLLKLEDGKPLRLRPFQRAILRDHFGKARELVVIIPKKNGKTTLLAALALFHAATVERPEVIIVAASRDQAGVMFGQAVMLLEQAGEPVRGTGWRGSDPKNVYTLGGTTFEIRKGNREIRARGGRIKVLAADADTADGVIPTLALVDELHRHRDGALYDVLMRGIGPRRGRMVTISTAGWTEESALGFMRRRAHERRPTRVTSRQLRYAQHEFVLHELALDPEKDDPGNLRHVKLVNPLQPMAELRRMQASPSNTPGQWLRFTCGIWTAGAEPEILPADWDRLRADAGSVEDGDTVVLAPSAGHSAVIGIAAMRPDGKVAVRADHVETGSGSILARLEDRIVELCERYDVLEVLDPGYGMQRSMDLLRRRGVPVEEAPYSTPRQIAATGTFDRYLRAGDLIHDGDPATRSHVLAAVKRVGTSGEHYVASDRTRAIVAIAQAVHAATAFSPERLVVILPSKDVG